MNLRKEKEYLNVDKNKKKGHKKMNNQVKFYYGAMGCGKTRELLKLWYSKKEDGFNTIIIKPQKDKKGDKKIVSRDNGQLEVNFLIKEEDNIYEIITKYITDYNLDTILVDEAQFLNEMQIKQLTDIADLLNIDVICFGLLTDFQGKLFEGSKALIEWDAKLIELERQCKCGNKKAFNARFINDEFVLDGDQVAIDGIEAKYEPVCRKCYKKLVKTKRKEKQ